MNPNTPSDNAPQKRKMSDGKRFLFAFLAFFSVVFVADGIFVYIAMTSQDGLVEKNYYQKGLHYDDVIQAKKRQAELGWSFELMAPAKAGTAPLEVRLTDAKGEPLVGKQVAAALRRPAQKGYDLDVTLEEVQPGTYRAEVQLPLQGLWDLKTEVRDAQDQATFESRFTVSS